MGVTRVSFASLVFFFFLSTRVDKKKKNSEAQLYSLLKQLCLLKGRIYQLFSELSEALSYGWIRFKVIFFYVGNRVYFIFLFLINAKREF